MIIRWAQLGDIGRQGAAARAIIVVGCIFGIEDLFKGEPVDFNFSMRVLFVPAAPVFRLIQGVWNIFHAPKSVSEGRETHYG